MAAEASLGEHLVKALLTAGEAAPSVFRLQPMTPAVYIPALSMAVVRWPRGISSAGAVWRSPCSFALIPLLVFACASLGSQRPGRAFERSRLQRTPLPVGAVALATSLLLKMGLRLSVGAGFAWSCRSAPPLSGGHRLGLGGHWQHPRLGTG